MAWQQNQKMLANLVRFLSKSQGKGHRWEDQSWEGASWDMNKGKGKGKATSGKGKGKRKGKADGEAWEAPWRNATASPTPKNAVNADAEDEGPWICLKCYTSHDHPGGWKMKRCRHCRANKHSTRDDNKANKEHKEQPPSLKETTLRNRYKTLNEVDADGEIVGNMEEQAKYEDDNNYHLEAIADAKVKGWTEVSVFHQKILDQMKPPMPLQPLKDLQYFNNRQIQAESAHRKRIEGLNTNIKDSQDKIEKLKGDQESKLNMMKEEYDKSVAAQKDAFKKAINMLEQGILEAQTQITTSTAEHQATCAEIRDTIDVINSKTHTASTKYQQQRQHEDRKKKNACRALGQEGIPGDKSCPHGRVSEQDGWHIPHTAAVAVHLGLAHAGGCCYESDAGCQCKSTSATSGSYSTPHRRRRRRRVHDGSGVGPGAQRCEGSRRSKRGKWSRSGGREELEGEKKGSQQKPGRRPPQ